MIKSMGQCFSMRRGAISAAMFSIISGCYSPETPAPEMVDILIENVSVIDAKDGMRVAQSVSIKGSQILSVTDFDPQTARDATIVIDGSGQFLIPGLWDEHVHVTFDPDIDYSTFFPLAMGHGVTSLRDTGGHLDRLAPARETADSDPLAPDLYVSGPLIDGPLRVYAGQTPFHPDISVGVSSESQAEDMVDQLADAGVDFVKAYEMLSPTVFSALVARAHERGLPVAGHAPLSMTAFEAASVGTDDMQHLRNLELACAPDAASMLSERLTIIEENDAPHPAILRTNIHRAQRTRAVGSLVETSCDDLIAHLAENNVAQTPTLAASRFLTHGLYGDPAYTASFSLLPEPTRSQWPERSARFSRPSEDEAVLAHDAWMQDMVASLSKSGVPIIAGTDAPIGFLTPGASLHRELQLLVEAGLTPLQALEAATLAPAAFFGIEDQQGLIRADMRADLVLLRSNPLIDISNSTSVESVIKDGRLIERETLDQLLATHADELP